MNTIFLLLLILVIVFFFVNRSNNKENFVQVKNTLQSPSTNAVSIKPIQVTNQYKPLQNLSQRDDWVSNPNNSPNIAPKLINQSDDLPGTAKRNFEDSPTYNTLDSTLNNDKSNKKSLNSILNNQPNPKGIRPNSGHLIRPIELDSSPSINTISEKPYLMDQASSEYLEYTTNPISNEYNYSNNTNTYQESNQNIIPEEVGTITKLPENSNISQNTDIAKKLIKKAAQLSIISTQGNDPVLSLQKANYAIGYIDALRDIMSESEIKSLVNIDLDKFTKELKNIQNFNIINMKMKCPSVSSDKKYLLNIAKNL